MNCEFGINIVTTNKEVISLQANIKGYRSLDIIFWQPYFIRWDKSNVLCSLDEVFELYVVFTNIRI